MPKRSAGLLMFRGQNSDLELFIVHPGGPFWAGKDAGAWSIPKGEYAKGENPLDAARREFHEETSFTAEGEFHPLGEIRQYSGKIVTAWAFEGDAEPAQLRSNTCHMEWPPRSGRTIVIPEVDRGGWFTPDIARAKLIHGQDEYVDRLLKLLDGQ